MEGEVNQPADQALARLGPVVGRQCQVLVEGAARHRGDQLGGQLDLELEAARFGQARVVRGQALAPAQAVLFDEAADARIGVVAVSSQDPVQRLVLVGQVESQGGSNWILALPEKPTGGADWNRVARMNNLSG